MTHTLKITVHEASRLEDVERFGKNDPYARVAINIADPKNFQKTKTKKNAGKEAVWNETLTLQNFSVHDHLELYVEVMDEETTADEPIAFCAIPLTQVHTTPHHALRGRFNLFTVDGKQKGEIVLTIAVVIPGQAEPHHVGAEVQGTSRVDTAHQARMKNLKNKEKAADGATLLAGGALALGAKYLIDKHKIDKKAEKAAREQ
ncbi:hypothetical protein BGX33_005267 [Mortierella sp. NVP41]|nr:hypothetical protein BGX33_005267 [Mortierella sp. NVP41]